jgi:hypothetical protein
LPPIIFLKWKRNLDQGALTQRVQDAATDTESSQPGKAQDVRKEEVFITTEMTKVKAQRKDPAEVLEAHVTEEIDRGRSFGGSRDGGDRPHRSFGGSHDRKFGERKFDVRKKIAGAAEGEGGEVKERTPRTYSHSRSFATDLAGALEVRARMETDHAEVLEASRDGGDRPRRSFGGFP